MSNNFFGSLQFFYAAGLVLNFIVAILLLLKYRSSRYVSYYFFLFVGLLMWGIGDWTVGNPTTTNLDIYLGRLSFFGATLVAWALLMFSLSFPDPNFRATKKMMILLGILPFLFAALSFSPWIEEGVRYYDWGVDSIYGPVYPFFAIYLTAYIVSAIVLMARTFRRSKNVLREQYKWMLIGIGSASAVGVFCNLIYPIVTGYSKLSAVGPALTIPILSLSLLFVMLRYRFLGIRIFFKKNAVQLALVVMGLSVTTYAFMILNRIAQEQLNISPKISTSVMIALITLSLPVLQFGIKRLLDRFVPHEVVDFGRVADLMNESIARSKDVDDVVFRLSKEIEKSLMVDEVTFLVRDEKFQTFVSVYPKQFNVRFEFDHPFIDFMQGVERVFHLFQLYDFMKGQGAAFAEKMNPIYQLLLKRKVAIIAPIGVYDEMVGLVLIPERRNGDQYSPEDLLELERFFTDVRPHLTDLLKTGKLDPAVATASTSSDVASSIKMDHEIN